MTEQPDPALLARLEAAMATVPKIDREIYLAARLDGMSDSQIARITGRSVRDIERRMSRAIHLISAALEKGGGP